MHDSNTNYQMFMQFVFLNDQTPSALINQTQAVNSASREAPARRFREDGAARRKPQQNHPVVLCRRWGWEPLNSQLPSGAFSQTRCHPSPEENGRNKCSSTAGAGRGAGLRAGAFPGSLAASVRGCLQRGGREGGRKASGKAGDSFKSADEELLPCILLFAPRAMQTRV